MVTELVNWLVVASMFSMLSALKHGLKQMIIALPAGYER